MSTTTATKRSKDRGQPLLVEVSIPVALGLLVLIAALGLVVTVAARSGGPLAYVAVPVALALTAGLGGWIAWVLRDTALRPLERIRTGLLGLEEGDFDAHIDPDGAREFRDLAHSFNRSVAFLGHQRQRLKQLAATDPLTGLANHRSLHEQLRTEVERINANGGHLSVVAIDLDGFKQINEERGHARGDEALQQIAGALKGAVREGDLVARLGGDEFLLLLRDADPGQARELVDHARTAVEQAVPDDIRVPCSAGYVCYPDEAGADADLVELAGAALRVAKRDGGARTQRFDTEQVTTLPTRRAERQEIEELLQATDPIEPVFQPIVELATGRLVGYEALARFPAKDARTPDAFFNQASRVGLGPQLEAVALEAALRAPRRPTGTYLSLNLTPSAISSTLTRAALPNDLKDVVIEITEHELAPEDGALEAGLAELRGRGARIAIDDAGAGYAGLQSVMRVQPDIIKLDRSLVQSVDTDSARSALIEFFVVFARRIQADVCCEGIETPGELAALAALGVKLGQGYLLGRPSAPWAPIAPPAVSAIAQLQSSGVLRAAAVSQNASPVNRRLARTGARR
jgi:diguanylate cyclase (GGDEF)-like protein